MDNSIYVTISRQTGLLKEFTAIANNMANTDTIGFKREGAIFSEYVTAASGAVNPENPRHSISMGRLAAHTSDMTLGSLNSTGGTLDAAIEGDGFFLSDVEGETLLTRAGHFLTNAQGILINPDGHPILNNGEGQIQIPRDAKMIRIGTDGIISADGNALGQLGIVTAEIATMERMGGNNWRAREGFEPLENPKVLQGFLEDSNVNPVIEIARMIEVQRSYDAGQKLLDMEDERIRQVITALRQMV